MVLFYYKLGTYLIFKDITYTTEALLILHLITLFFNNILLTIYVHKLILTPLPAPKSHKCINFPTLLE